jgi:hypothetical protein
VAGGVEVPELNQHVWVGRAIEVRDRFNAAEVRGFNRRVTKYGVIEATDFCHLISLLIGTRPGGVVGSIASCRGRSRAESRSKPAAGTAE